MSEKQKHTVPLFTEKEKIITQSLGEEISAEKMYALEQLIEQFTMTQLLYQSVLREISTKLEILNDEFQSIHEYNPIEHIKSRVKSPRSILEKLIRRGCDLSWENAVRKLHDIAGIRVICSFIDDIYRIAAMLLAQDDVSLICKKDYIKHPKANGYRSLHLVVEVPVFFSNRVERVKAEVQIRTVAMDFWASLEHKLRYKRSEKATAEIVQALKACSDQISQLDQQMMEINHQIAAAKKEDPDKTSFS